LRREGGKEDKRRPAPKAAQNDKKPRRNKGRGITSSEDERGKQGKKIYNEQEWPAEISGGMNLSLQTNPGRRFSPSSQAAQLKS
jgi:hypothetical protein